MADIRKIKKVLKGRPVVEGAGVHLKRALGNEGAVPMFDPFLLLDDFHSFNPAQYLPGFPWHPHRGIETITYVLEGEVDHGDSMGNKGMIHPGDVQWMTAGSGIIHQEMPRGLKDGHLWGFQLWANLPASHKMMDPRYQGITSNRIPQVVTDNGAKVKIICGQFNKVQGPVRDIVTDPEYLDIALPPNSQFRHAIGKGRTAMAYILEGAGIFDDNHDPYSFEEVEENYFDFKRERLFSPEHLIAFTDGDDVLVTTENKPVRFLLISGNPLREPVAWYGPIVMNTQGELRTAFEEYQKGDFIKHKQPQK
ncbi:MAG TPA: pirin family protein [Dehalococcoidales bacterium]|nr:pirin family protein [Dehalococcoidales bacterium]